MSPEQNPLSGVKVMVIDDSNTIRRSAEIFLLQAGCTVILAEDGFDALAKITDHLTDLFAQVADRTTVELDQLALEAEAFGEWHSGEVTGPGTFECKSCGELKRPHNVCQACGHYDGREVKPTAANA